jgi:cytoskeletal protein RodZ
MEPLGTRLKRAREQRGITLRQIAEATKISVSALEAIERNDFRRLPGGIFSRSFLRAYADEVGLDPDAAIREFAAEMGKRDPGRARPAARADVTPDDLIFLERQRRAARVLRVAVILLIVIVIAIALWLLRPDSWWPQAAAPPPAAASPGVRSSTSGPPPPADPLPPPQVATADAGLRIEIEVLVDCWVRATTDGAIAVERLLRPGEKQQLSANREVHLEVGNAGALRWFINGRPAKPLGEADVRREARITRDNYAQFLQQDLTGG